MRLILIRHAATFSSDSARWPDDGLRPLTPTGMEEFRESAAGLARIVGSVDILLASPLVRTRQTAEILSAAAGWPRAVTAPQLAPGQPAELALGIVRDLELRALGPGPAADPGSGPDPDPGSDPDPDPGPDAEESRGPRSLALVGHEPNLLELIALCLAGDDAGVRCDIDKGGAACLQFPAAVSAGEARLEWLLIPRALRALAGR